MANSSITQLLKARLLNCLIAFLLINCAREAKKTFYDFPTFEIPNLAIVKLKNTKSFSFNYWFTTATQEPVISSFRGSTVLPNQEEWNGFLKRKDKRIGFQVKIFGDFQYERKGNKWGRYPRSPEFDIFKVLEQIVKSEKEEGFELVSEDNRYLIFKFTPNVPFLDPGFNKKFEGTFLVQKSNLLPYKIQVFEAKEKFLELNFYNYNRVKPIKIPFIRKEHIQLVGAGTRKELLATAQILKKRFEQLGLRSELQIFQNRIELFFEEKVSNQILDLITTRGDIVIYYDSVPVFTKSDIAEVKFENSSLIVKIRNSAFGIRNYKDIFLSIDGSIIDYLKINVDQDRLFGKIISIDDSPEMVKTLAAVINSEILPVKLEVLR